MYLDPFDEAILKVLRREKRGKMLCMHAGFGRLRHACRYEKGGFCKRVRKRCAPTSCPLIK